jgi:hypothetical protein
MDAAGPCKRPILPFFCLVLTNHRLPEPEDACDVCYLPQASKCFFSNEVHVCEEAQRVSNYALLLDQDF